MDEERAKLYVPKQDTTLTRNYEQRLVSLPIWGIQALLAFSTALEKEWMWLGDGQSLRNAQNDAAALTVALMTEVQAMSGVIDVRLTSEGLLEVDYGAGFVPAGQHTTPNGVSDVQLLSDGSLQKDIGAGWIAAGQHTEQDITDANATTLDPGEPATAEIINTILELGIPEGLPGQDGQDGDTPFTTVSVTTLPAGSNATAAIVNGVLELGIPRGDQGIQGIQGEPGASDVFEIPILNPDVDNDTRRCASAFTLSEWLFDKFGEMLDIWDAAVNTAGALDLLLIGFPPAYFIVDQVLDLMNEVSDVGSSVARTAITVANKEDVAERLYCFMTEEGNLTTSSWADFIENLEQDFLDPGEVLFIGWLQSFDGNAAVHRSRISGYGDGNSAICATWDCGDVTEWEHTINLISTSGGLYAYAGEGVYVGGTGWQSEQYFDPDYPQRLGIRLDLPANAYIVSMRVTYSGTHFSGVDGAYLSTKLNGNVQSGAPFDISDGSNQTLTLNGQTLLADQVQIFMSSQTSNDTNEFTVTELYLSGVGDNPFA